MMEGIAEPGVAVVVQVAGCHVSALVAGAGHHVRPRWSATTVAFMMFCFFFPA
ncbi:MULTISPECIES: hypothetical protein [Streptomyces]|uniref:Uncharacterized protein n=1 Tax=Streptomyces albidocamelliae TaxID=2981135 RepID=A0ABY6EY08_9ACTN|nr:MULTISPECIES: hypothetical protein [unclassified Streptomyces]UXY39285.1 hypothetical protein N8I86_33995 [Streptomyces sp. HUAS 14-6]